MWPTLLHRCYIWATAVTAALPGWAWPASRSPGHLPHRRRLDAQHLGRRVQAPDGAPDVVGGADDSTLRGFARARARLLMKASRAATAVGSKVIFPPTRRGPPASSKAASSAGQQRRRPSASSTPAAPTSSPT